MPNQKIEHRLTSLEVTQKEMLKVIREIKEKLEYVEKQMYKRPGWMITGLVSLVVGMAIYILTSL